MNEDTGGNTEQKIGDFIGGFKVGQPVDLVLGISDGNKKQEGAELKAFVDMVNFNKIKIKSVEIMVTAYIQRHYYGEEEALRRRDKWIAENKEILAELKVPYKITDWKDIIETTEFQEGLQKTMGLYESDNAFQLKVNNMAQSHKQKGSLEKAHDYVCEEAAYFTYKKVHVCYPADRLNIACEHIIENHNENAVFHAYRFKPRFEKKLRTPPQNKGYAATPMQQPMYIPVPMQMPMPMSQSQGYLGYGQQGFNNIVSREDVLIASLSLARLMSTIGINGTREKTAYFQQVLQQTEQFTGSCHEEIRDEGVTNEEKKKTVGLQSFS